MTEPQVTSGAELRRKGRPFVTVPQTGNTYQMRHATVSALIKAGVLPENYVAEQIKAQLRAAAKRNGNGQPVEEASTDKDLLENEDVMRTLLRATMLNPRMVERAEADDEVEFEDLPAEDREYLFLWATHRLPDQTLETADGEGVTVEAVGKFSTESGQPAGDSVDSRDVRGERREEMGTSRPGGRRSLRHGSSLPPPAIQA